MIFAQILVLLPQDSLQIVVLMLGFQLLLVLVYFRSIFHRVARVRFDRLRRRLTAERPLCALGVSE